MSADKPDAEWCIQIARAQVAPLPLSPLLEERIRQACRDEDHDWLDKMLFGVDTSEVSR